MLPAHYFQKYSTQEIESISYTVKEINTVAGLHTYTVVAFCEPESFVIVKEIWGSVFTGVDVLFFADEQFTNRSGSLTNSILAPCILQIVASDHVCILLFVIFR